MPKLTRAGNIVSITQPGMKVNFNTTYGGAPLEVYNMDGAPTLVTDPLPGKGFQTMWDTAQDPTQSGATGVDAYPITPLTTFGDSYYAREEAFIVDKDSHECLYQVSGPAPFFWISHEPADDAVPSDSRGPSGWCTLYNNFLNLPPSTFSMNGVPIFGAPRGAVTSGIILLGNELKTGPWYERICKVKNGNASFKVRVSMKDAPADALGGIYFRKKADYVASDNIDSVYNAPGAVLMVNKQGGVAFHNSDGIVTTVLNQDSSVNTDLGIELEIRSILGSDYVHVYVNGKKLLSILSPYRGEALGLFYQCNSGKVKFHYRNFFDMGWNFVNEFRSTLRNTLYSKISIYRVAEPYSAPLYRINSPVCYLQNGLGEKSFVWDLNGVKSEFIGLKSLDTIKAIYAGKANGSLGMFCKIHSYSEKGKNFAHAGIEPSVFALSNLSKEANNTPEEVSSAVMILEWAPKIREDLL